jgi:hypothetical protein
MGFAAYWRWKSRSLGGRPRIGKELRDPSARRAADSQLTAFRAEVNRRHGLGLKDFRDLSARYIEGCRNRALAPSSSTAARAPLGLIPMGIRWEGWNGTGDWTKGQKCQPTEYGGSQDQTAATAA